MSGSSKDSELVGVRIEVLRGVATAAQDVEGGHAATRRLAVVREVTALEYLIAQQFLLLRRHIFRNMLLVLQLLVTHTFL